MAKYLAIYNGMMFPFDDLKEFAINILGYKIIQNCRGAWDIIINGEEVAHYSNEYTLEEVERNFLSEQTFFFKFTFSLIFFSFSNFYCSS